MIRKIKTYDALLQEEQRLTAQMHSCKDLIKQDITRIKEGLNPVKRGAKVVKNLFSREDKGPLLNFGLNFGLDVLLRRTLLGRAGWITKVMVPYLAKNYASHLITEDQRKAVGKSLSKFISKVLMKKQKESFEATPPS